MEIALIVLLALGNAVFVSVHHRDKARLSVLASEDACFDLGGKLEAKPAEMLDVVTLCEQKRKDDIAAEKAEADNHAAHLLDEYR